MLPETENIKLQKNNFPTLWQAVLYRNYGFVEDKNLADVLGTDIKTIKTEAERLGLKDIKYNPEWLKSGYLTIIKNNWFLLDYEQLCTLLGWDEKRLDYVVKEEDFLYVKLGFVKPHCEKARFCALSGKQKKETENAARILNRAGADEARAFGFFDFEKADSPRVVRAGTRIIHGYITPCGDTFGIDSETYLPDTLLSKYAAVGVNGLWFHALLTDLSPYPFKNTGERYVVRRENLRKLIERCAEYGIKDYLYFNEPRCMSTQDFSGQEDIKGTESGEFSALCMGTEKVRNYLYRAVRELFSEVKNIGGVITITMSENLTHCHSVGNCNCHRCADFKPYEEAARVNNIIMRAIKDSGSKAELIANLWGWSEFLGWSKEDTERGVALLDKDISVLCVSEYDLKIVKGGVKSKIIDYSLSNPGPSEVSRDTLAYAGRLGHKTYAKVQFNNSWECSAVPFLPAFDLVYEHLVNLKKAGVENYMMSWTLGGWPSVTLDLVNSFGENFDLEAWYADTFGKNAEAVHDAIKYLCKGFSEYPFSIDALYLSPKTHGYANLWETESENKRSCMVSYSFDDYENWIKPYPYEVYVSQMKKLLDGFGKAIEILSEIKEDKEVYRLWLYTSVAYLHFYADYDQTVFSFFKRDLENNKDKIYSVLCHAKKATEELINLQKQDTKIGYEASNHYFYTTRSLKEKLLNIENLKKELEYI